jgi:hypothetical protein
MPIQNDSLNRKLYDLLNARGYNPVPRDSDVSNAGKTVPPEEADVFKFTFKQGKDDIDDAWVTIDGAQNLTLYYDQELANKASERTPGTQFDDSWYGLLNHLKKWSHSRQLSFKLEPKEKIDSDMAQRTYMKKKEQIAEGYYPMGKTASYSDAVPTVKIILQHSRQIQEGEQRYRNVSKIFLENAEGERFLSPTNKPGLAQVYARHLAEGGVPNDERWNHLKSLCEEYSQMAGFVRAVRNNQFNESAQRLVNEGLNHYQGLRESLSKLRGSRGYNTYFESWTPALMETEGDDQTNLNELFVQETLDPRIESVIPILNKLSKNLGEMKEVSELAEWADSLIESPGAETLAHNQATEKSRLDAFDLDENDGGQQALNPVGIPEEDELDEAMDPEKRARLDDLIGMYRDSTDPSDYYDSEYEDPEEVLNMIRSEFGDRVASTIEAGTDKMHFPRKDHDQGYDPMSWKKPIDRQTKAGKMYKQDSDYRKNTIKARFKNRGSSAIEGVEEGILDTVKKVGGKVLDKLGHGSDEDLLKDLQKKAGVRGPNHGKPSMAQSDVEKRTDEVDMGQADSSLRSEPKQNNDKMDHFTALGKASKKMGHDHYMDVPDDKVEALKAMVKKFRSGEEVDESALQAYLGDKKYGKDGMDALRKAGQEDASEKTMQNIRAKYSSKEEPISEEGVAEGSGANKTYLAMAYLKAVVMAPMGTPEKRRILNWQQILSNQFDIEMDPASLAQMLPQFDSQLKSGQLDKLQNRMASRGELEIGESNQGVAEGEFAGDFATGEAGQWRNKGPKANKPATVGDLVGEGQEDLDALKRLLGK